MGKEQFSYLSTRQSIGPQSKSDRADGITNHAGGRARAVV
jgi:hypothetical protein